MRRLCVLASKASTEVLSWKVDGRLGNLSLSVPDWAKKQLDIRAVFDMQMGVCLEHSFESRQKDGVKDGFQCQVKYDASTGLIQELVQQSIHGDFQETRFSFQQVDEPVLSYRDCTLSAFGIPEPEGFSSNSSRRWITSIGVFLFCIGLLLFGVKGFVHAKNLRRKLSS